MPLYNPSSGGGASAAEDVTIADAGAYYTGTEVEAALQEIGAGGIGGGGATAFIGCSASRTTAQSINDSTWTNIDLTATDTFDTDGFHDPSTNSNRVTIPAGLGGNYLIIATVTHAQNSTGSRYAGIAKNGSASPFKSISKSADTVLHHTLQLSDVVNLAAGDYVSLMVYQDKGSANDINSGSLVVAKLDSGKVGAGIGAQAYNSATQSIPDAASTALTFDSEAFDTDGFHSTSVNTSRMTIPAGLGGKYLLVAGGRWDEATGTLSSELWFRKNGTTTLHGSDQGHTKIDGAVSSAQTIAIADLVAGDYVEVVVYQDSSGAQPFGHASANEARAALSIMRLDSGSSPAYAGCSLTKSAVQSIADNTDVAITFDGELFDTDGFHDNSTNNSRITIPTGRDGKYLVAASVGYVANATGRRDITLTKNGSTTISNDIYNNVGASGPTRVARSTVLALVAGDYLEMVAYQNSGGALNAEAGATGYPTSFSVSKIG